MLISQAKIVNEGKVVEADVLIKGQHVAKIAPFIAAPPRTKVLDAKGKLLKTIAPPAPYYETLVAGAVHQLPFGVGFSVAQRGAWLHDNQSLIYVGYLAMPALVPALFHFAVESGTSQVVKLWPEWTPENRQILDAVADPTGTIAYLVVGTHLPDYSGMVANVYAWNAVTDETVRLTSLGDVSGIGR